MLPEGAVNLICSQPRLRGHLQEERGLTLAWDRSDQVKVVIGVERGNVAIQSGLLASWPGGGANGGRMGGGRSTLFGTTGDAQRQCSRQKTTPRQHACTRTAWR